DHLRRLGFGLGQTFAGFGVAGSSPSKPLPVPPRQRPAPARSTPPINPSTPNPFNPEQES
ncbi:hypothetical protein AB9F38_36860, partial [Rhizobium leguminosarum]